LSYIVVPLDDFSPSIITGLSLIVSIKNLDLLLKNPFESEDIEGPFNDGAIIGLYDNFFGRI
jgi:hypothetical protein